MFQQGVNRFLLVIPQGAGKGDVERSPLRAAVFRGYGNPGVPASFREGFVQSAGDPDIAGIVFAKVDKSPVCVIRQPYCLIAEENRIGKGGKTADLISKTRNRQVPSGKSGYTPITSEASAFSP